jgi:shikimate dehydrogenase
LTGANTDAPALLDALREEGGFDAAGQAVVLLGASGAARAAGYALVEAGVQRLVVANRTLERAELLLGDLLASRGGDTITVQDVSGNGSQPLIASHAQSEEPEPQFVALALDDSDLAEYIATSNLLINATSLGWEASMTPLPDPPVVPGMLVYDMVYRTTRLLREAEARGARTLNGLGMLVRQGALAFTRWTGQAAPLDVMHEALALS